MVVNEDLDTCRLDTSSVPRLLYNISTNSMCTEDVDFFIPGRDSWMFVLFMIWLKTNTKEGEPDWYNIMLTHILLRA